ncbi:fatty acid alpha-hydroxylase [Entomortierella beljakovae]|nr:fatty acid alpha-hydroxylase [Entomortierella beljakovae]
MAPKISVQQINEHNTASSCWVILNNKVYDITPFIADHPGGEELILDNAGTDITLLMKDELSHLHSEGAYEMMDEYLVGVVDTASNTSTETTAGLLKRNNNVSSAFSISPKAVQVEEADYHRPTNLEDDKKKKFLNLSQPLLWQLWNSDYTKKFYLEQVHIPRHVSGSAKIFGSPYLEVFTKTPWYIIPMFWLPVVAYNVIQSLNMGLAPEMVLCYFIFGIVLWSLLEYILHRFLFHLDDYLPDSTIYITAHFLLHECDFIHVAHAVMAGAFLGYILYDMTHYYLHHAKVFKIHFTKMKTYHLAHHYKNFEGGYGITSKLWDQ